MFRYNVIGQEVGKVSFRLYGKNIVVIAIINKKNLSASYLQGGDPQLLLFVQVATPVWGGAKKLVWKYVSTCIDQQFALLPSKLMVLQVYAEDMYAYSNWL
jgi:hypothetical protein